MEAFEGPYWYCLFLVRARCMSSCYFYRCVFSPEFQIAFYGLGLNSSIILQAIGFGSAVSTGSRGVYDNLMNVSVGNVILSVAGLIPGYWASFFLIDKWGRKPIQLMGFILLTVLFIVMGKLFNLLHHAGD